MLPPGEVSPASELFPDIALPGGDLVGGDQDEMLKSPTLKVSPNSKILPRMGEAEFIAAEARRRAQGGGPQGPPAGVSLFGSEPAGQVLDALAQ